MTTRGTKSPMDFQYRGTESPMDFQYRGTESPMDFQYDSPLAPKDPDSPFSRFSAMGSTLNETPKKRSLTTFQSSTSSKPPILTPPTSQHFPFPKTAYQIPPTPTPLFRTISTTTPRSTVLDMSDFTKDPDLFSTPARAQAENSEDDDGNKATPEHLQSPQKEPKPIIFGGTTTPSRRGEVPRGRYHDGAITKLKPRRHQRRPCPRTITDDEDSSPERDVVENIQTRTWQSKWASTHRDTPLIISQYFQVCFNLSILLLCLYALFCFYLTIKRDVDQKVYETSAHIVEEMSQCTRRYVENRCSPDMRVPAMEKACQGWEKCMNRDPQQVGRARVSAETFAEIINSFIEPISYKAMFFSLLLIFGGLFFSNFAFGLYRAKAINHPAPYLAAAIPPIASRLEQKRPSTLISHIPRPSTPIRETPSGNVHGTPEGRESIMG